MNNVCTLETSSRLAAAGFPQPAPGDEQFWWVPDSRTETGWELTVVIRAGGMQEQVLQAYPERVFAPGPGDLLRELGELYDLSISGEKFCCTKWKSNGPWKDAEVDMFYFHENPAEALAEAWFDKRIAELIAQIKENATPEQRRKIERAEHVAEYAKQLATTIAQGGDIEDALNILDRFVISGKQDFPAGGIVSKTEKQ